LHTCTQKHAMHVCTHIVTRATTYMYMYVHNARMHVSKTINCNLFHAEGKYFTIPSHIHKLKNNICKCM